MKNLKTFYIRANITHTEQPKQIESRLKAYENWFGEKRKIFFQICTLYCSLDEGGK